MIGHGGTMASSSTGSATSFTSLPAANISVIIGRRSSQRAVEMDDVRLSKSTEDSSTLAGIRKANHSKDSFAMQHQSTTSTSPRATSGSRSSARISQMMSLRRDDAATAAASAAAKKQSGYGCVDTAPRSLNLRQQIEHDSRTSSSSASCTNHLSSGSTIFAPGSGTADGLDATISRMKHYVMSLQPMATDPSRPPTIQFPVAPMAATVCETTGTAPLRSIMSAASLPPTSSSSSIGWSSSSTSSVQYSNLCVPVSFSSMPIHQTPWPTQQPMRIACPLNMVQVQPLLGAPVIAIRRRQPLLPFPPVNCSPHPPPPPPRSHLGINIPPMSPPSIGYGGTGAPCQLFPLGVSSLHSPPHGDQAANIVLVMASGDAVEKLPVQHNKFVAPIGPRTPPQTPPSNVSPEVQGRSLVKKEDVLEPCYTPDLKRPQTIIFDADLTPTSSLAHFPRPIDGTLDQKIAVVSLANSANRLASCRSVTSVDNGVASPASLGSSISPRPVVSSSSSTVRRNLSSPSIQQHQMHANLGTVSPPSTSSNSFPHCELTLSGTSTSTSQSAPLQPTKLQFTTRSTSSFSTESRGATSVTASTSSSGGGQAAALYLLGRQRSIVSNITRQLSNDLNSIAMFLRQMNAPDEISDEERSAMSSMQTIAAEFRALTPICADYRLLYAQVTSGLPTTAGDGSANSCSHSLPTASTLVNHEKLLAKCRDSLRTIFADRHQLVLQTAIAIEQRQLTFRWLKRFHVKILDCIAIIYAILEEVVNAIKVVGAAPLGNCSAVVSGSEASAAAVMPRPNADPPPQVSVTDVDSISRKAANEFSVLDPRLIRMIQKRESLLTSDSVAGDGDETVPEQRSNATQKSAPIRPPSIAHDVSPDDVAVERDDVKTENGGSRDDKIPVLNRSETIIFDADDVTPSTATKTLCGDGRLSDPESKPTTSSFSTNAPKVHLKSHHVEPPAPNQKPANETSLSCGFDEPPGPDGELKGAYEDWFKKISRLRKRLRKRKKALANADGNTGNRDDSIMRSCEQSRVKSEKSRQRDRLMNGERNEDEDRLRFDERSKQSASVYDNVDTCEDELDEERAIGGALLSKEKILALFEARDRRTFSRLLIDSVCSMPSEDFRRVREMLLRRLAENRLQEMIGTGVCDVTSGASLPPLDASQTNKISQKLEAKDETSSSGFKSLSISITDVRSCQVFDAADCKDAELEQINETAASSRAVLPSNHDVACAAHDVTKSRIKRRQRRKDDVDVIIVDSSSDDDDVIERKCKLNDERMMTSNVITIAPLESNVNIYSTDCNDDEVHVVRRRLAGHYDVTNAQAFEETRDHRYLSVVGDKNIALKDIVAHNQSQGYSVNYSPSAHLSRLSSNIQALDTSHSYIARTSAEISSLSSLLHHQMIPGLIASTQSRDSGCGHVAGGTNDGALSATLARSSSPRYIVLAGNSGQRTPNVSNSPAPFDVDATLQSAQCLIELTRSVTSLSRCLIDAEQRRRDRYRQSPEDRATADPSALSRGFAQETSVSRSSSAVSAGRQDGVIAAGASTAKKKRRSSVTPVDNEVKRRISLVPLSSMRQKGRLLVQHVDGERSVSQMTASKAASDLPCRLESGESMSRTSRSPSTVSLTRVCRKRVRTTSGDASSASFGSDYRSGRIVSTTDQRRKFDEHLSNDDRSVRRRRFNTDDELESVDRSPIRRSVQSNENRRCYSKRYLTTKTDDVIVVRDFRRSKTSQSRPLSPLRKPSQSEIERRRLEREKRHRERQMKDGEVQSEDGEVQSAAERPRFFDRRWVPPSKLPEYCSFLKKGETSPDRVSLGCYSSISSSSMIPGDSPSRDEILTAAAESDGHLAGSTAVGSKESDGVEADHSKTLTNMKSDEMNECSGTNIGGDERGLSVSGNDYLGNSYPGHVTSRWDSETGNSSDSRDLPTKGSSKLGSDRCSGSKVRSSASRSRSLNVKTRERSSSDGSRSSSRHSTSTTTTTTTTSLNSSSSSSMDDQSGTVLSSGSRKRHRKSKSRAKRRKKRLRRRETDSDDESDSSKSYRRRRMISRKKDATGVKTINCRDDVTSDDDAAERDVTRMKMPVANGTFGLGLVSRSYTSSETD